MNFALQREIYGLTPWMVDLHSLPVLTSMIKNFQNGVQIEVPEIKYNTPAIYNLQNEVVLIESQYELDNDLFLKVLV